MWVSYTGFAFDPARSFGWRRFGLSIAALPTLVVGKEVRKVEMEDRSIVAEQLSRVFGQQLAVDSVDLEVPSGRVFGFLGPNGAGKSTVVRMLTTILAPTTGSARVAGFDVGRDGDEIRLRIGVALQDIGLDPLMTAQELLILQGRLFGMSAHDATLTALRMLKTVGLDQVDPKKRLGQYSGGMKRKLDLALALVHDPLILFLDEPTTGLDPSSRASVWEEVSRLNREEGMTIFLTTQYLEEADRLAEDLAIIDNGRIVASGSPSALKQQLGSEVVGLNFESPEVAARAQDALAGIGETTQLSGSELLAYFSVAAPMVPVIVRRLDEQSVPLVGLTLTKPTLDDVFLRATGQRLSVAEPSEKARKGAKK